MLGDFVQTENEFYGATNKPSGPHDRAGALVPLRARTTRLMQAPR